MMVFSIMLMMDHGWSDDQKSLFCKCTKQTHVHNDHSQRAYNNISGPLQAKTTPCSLIFFQYSKERDFSLQNF